jgi:hypothetical protein
VASTANPAFKAAAIVSRGTPARGRWGGLVVGWRIRIVLCVQPRIHHRPHPVQAHTPTWFTQRPSVSLCPPHQLQPHHHPRMRAHRNARWGRHPVRDSYTNRNAVQGGADNRTC